LQRAGGPSRCRHPGRGQPEGRRRAGGPWSRGAYLCGDRDRAQRLRRPHVHDPADPARMIENTPLRDLERAAADAVDAEWTTAALERLVRVPSVTGDEGAVQDVVAELLAEAGIRVERLDPDPAD